MLLVVFIVLFCFLGRKIGQAKAKKVKINYFLGLLFAASITFNVMEISCDNATVEYHTGQFILVKTNANNEDYYYAESTDDGFLCFSNVNNLERYKIRKSTCRIKYDSSEYLIPYVTYSEATYYYDPSISFWVDFGLLATKSRTEKSYVLVVPFGTIMTEAEISEKAIITEISEETIITETEISEETIAFDSI